MFKNFFAVFDFKHSVIARMFVILLVIFFVAFAVSTLIWYTNTKSLITSSYTSHLSDNIKQSNDKFENALLNTTALVQNLSKSANTLSVFDKDGKLTDTDEYRIYLNEILSLFDTSITGVSVTDMYGSNISVGSAYVQPNYNTSDLFYEIVNARGTSCYQLNKSTYTRSNCMTVGAAVMRGTNVVGTVIADIDNSIYISAFGTNSGAVMRTFIFMDDNDIVFSNDSTLGDEALSALMDASNEKGYANSLRQISVGNSTYLFSTQKNMFTGWTAVTFFDKNVIDAEYTRTITYILLSVMAMLAVAVLIAIFISYGQSKRIHALTSKISGIGLDNITVPPDSFDDGHKDELSLISAKIFEMTEKISKQFNEIRYLTEQKRLSDINVLKSQINPHFLYNALNSIESIAKMHNDKTVSEIASSLINLLHYSINTEDTLVCIDDELNYIKNYTEIMQTKYLDKISITYDTEPGLGSCKTQRMILQPIVENCIKHAFKNSIDKQIFIKTSLSGKDINISVTDNGIGAPPELRRRLKENSIPDGHYGLSNVNKRIKLTFGEEYGLDILSISGIQTTVIIKIPYINDNR